MKITGIHLHYVNPRWQFLRMDTDEGISGWSEAILEGRVQTVRSAIEELSRYLIGQDPCRIEYHWQRMYRGTFYRGGPILTSAIAAVEVAMWDIKGQALGIPVYDLLGGAVREKILAYCHIYGQTADALAQDAHAAMDEGFLMFKTSLDGPVPQRGTGAYIDTQIEKFQMLRDTIGPERDFAVDFHGRADPSLARQLLRALEPLRPLFVEEPCLPDNPSVLAPIAQSTSIPIATGERIYTRWGFAPLIATQAAAIYQPDVFHTGGLWETRKIAAMAEIHYAMVAPHNPLGPIALAANLQLDSCVPNFLCQELVRGLGSPFLQRPFELHDGYIPRPDGPGLGIEVDEDAIKAAANDGTWNTPTWLREDGSFAEW